MPSAAFRDGVQVRGRTKRARGVGKFTESLLGVWVPHLIFFQDTALLAVFEGTPMQDHHVMSGVPNQTTHPCVLGWFSSCLVCGKSHPCAMEVQGSNRHPTPFRPLTEFDLPRWVRNEFRDLNVLGLSTQVEGWLQLISIRV